MRKIVCLHLTPIMWLKGTTAVMLAVKPVVDKLAAASADTDAVAAQEQITAGPRPCLKNQKGKIFLTE